MDATAFVEVYNTLEQDHELVLDRVRALREMVAALMSPGRIDAPAVFARLSELEKFFVTQFLTHLDEEEKTLFPLLEQVLPEGGALAKRLRDEHDELRRKLDDFSNCLSVAIELQDQPPEAVLEDLLIYCWDLWELLDQHAHVETRSVNDCLKQILKSGKSMPA
jgi:hemerythrin-like domain-containing protein